MALTLSPTELTLVAAAVNEKIALLDDRYVLLAAAVDLLGVAARPGAADDLSTNRIMRVHYATIVRRVEQALDVPFVDQEEAQRVALAIERISSDFEEERNPEGDPTLNGAFR